jgi:putative SOS response-associated peptidase YedK
MVAANGVTITIIAKDLFKAQKFPILGAMCNRISGLREWSEIPRDLAGKVINFEYNPNVAPTEMVPAFLADNDKPVDTRLARFGINLPASGGKKRPPLLNVRTDTLRRGSFRTMLANHRCVIPAEGFYEWREEMGKKQPYFFYRKDGKPIMFAGIWDMSEVKGDKVPSFAILTDEPNELVAPYHDRMPVVLEQPKKWLQRLDHPLDALEPLPPEMFAVRPVNPAVNKVSQKDIAAIEAA